LYSYLYNLVLSIDGGTVTFNHVPTIHYNNYTTTLIKPNCSVCMAQLKLSRWDCDYSPNCKRKKKSVIFGVKTEADGGVMLHVQSVITSR